MTRSQIASIVMAAFFFLLTLVCVFGFLASFEPGTGIAWKIGYGFGILVFLFMSFRLLRRS